MNTIVITLFDDKSYLCPDGDEDQGFFVDNQDLKIESTDNNKIKIYFSVTVEDALIERSDNA